MKKVFQVSELDCANCARKVEDAIARIEGVTRVQLNFFSQKLTLEADDAQFARVFDEAVKAARKVEPDMVISK